MITRCPHCKQVVRIAGYYDKVDIAYDGKTIQVQLQCHQCNLMFTAKQAIKESNELVNNGTKEPKL